jgi:DNA-binding IclR family transcriptional regulator
VPDPLLAAAGPVLVGLRDDTGESAQLYIRDGSERVCVLAAEPAQGLRDTVPVGARLSMSAGSAAQVLAAWSPPAEMAGLLTAAAFSARGLAEVRRRGWAQSVAEREAGVASVSAPVRDRSGAVVAAVSVSGPIQRLGRGPGARLAPLVCAAAASLSRRLGETG